MRLGLPLSAPIEPSPARVAGVVVMLPVRRYVSGTGAAMGMSGLGAVLIANRAQLLRFLRARGAGDACEDILQDVWLKISSHTPSGPIADPLGYLYRVADNVMHDRFRAEDRRGRRESVWGEIASDEETPHAGAALERAMIAREELRRVEAELATLGERSRTIFRRFRIDGMGQNEIAREEGISLSAVEKHLQRAYRAVMRVSAPDHGDDTDTPRRRRSDR